MRRFQIDRDRHTVTFKVDRQMDRRQTDRCIDRQIEQALTPGQQLPNCSKTIFFIFFSNLFYIPPTHHLQSFDCLTLYSSSVCSLVRSSGRSSVCFPACSPICYSVRSSVFLFVLLFSYVCSSVCLSVCLVCLSLME